MGSARHTHPIKRLQRMNCCFELIWTTSQLSDLHVEWSISAESLVLWMSRTKVEILGKRNRRIAVCSLTFCPWRLAVCKHAQLVIDRVSKDSQQLDVWIDVQQVETFYLR